MDRFKYSNVDQFDLWNTLKEVKINKYKLMILLNLK